MVLGRMKDRASVRDECRHAPTTGELSHDPYCFTWQSTLLLLKIVKPILPTVGKTDSHSDSHLLTHSLTHFLTLSPSHSLTHSLEEGNVVRCRVEHIHVKRSVGTLKCLDANCGHVHLPVSHNVGECRVKQRRLMQQHGLADALSLHAM